MLLSFALGPMFLLLLFLEVVADVILLLLSLTVWDFVADAVVVVVVGPGTPPLTGSGIVRVVVQDVNDHSPVFERQGYWATVPENTPRGTTVLHARVTDLDEGLNAKIR